MKTTKQERREAKLLFKGCMVNGVLDEGNVRQTAKTLLEQKPRGYLAVLSHFQRLVKLEVERRTARIESAYALPHDLQERIKQVLAQTYGTGLNVSFAENPGLIGGTRIQVGSDVYDGSIRAKLNALEESFSQAQ